MLKAYSYVRYSSDKQHFSDSKRRQEQKTKEWCELNNYQYVDAGIDRAKSASSGANLKDSALSRFITDVKTGKIETPCVLCVEALDRVTRLKIKDAFLLFLELFQNDVQVASVTDNKLFGLETLDNNFEFISFLNKLEAAHSYTDLLGERSKASWDEKHRNMSKDNILTRSLPAWLDYDENKKEMIVVPERALIIKRIYNEYLGGKGIDSIVKDLNKEKVKTPSQWCGKRFAQKKDKFAGKLWSASTVRRFLMSHSVYGTHVPHTKGKNGEYQRKVPSGKPITNYYPPIISEKEFNVVQECIRQRTKNFGPRAKKLGNLFQGFCKCMLCGENMIYYAGSSKKYQYLKCKQQRKSNGCVTPPKMFHYQKFENAVITVLMTHIFQEIFLPTKSETYLNLVEERKTLLLQIENAEASVKKLVLKSIDVPDALAITIQEFKEKLNTVENQIKATPEEIDNFYTVEDAYENIRMGEQKPLENNLENRMKIAAAIKNFVSEIQVNPVTQEVCILSRYATDYMFKKVKGKSVPKFTDPKLNVFTCWLELDLEYNEDYVGGGFGATCNGLIHYNKKGKHPKSDDYIWTDFNHFTLWMSKQELKEEFDD